MVREGYVPPLSLRAQMRVVKEAESLPSVDSLIKIMEEAFENKAFDQDALGELLQLLGDAMQASPSFIDRVVRAFLSKQDPDCQLSAHIVSYVVRVYTRAGDTEGAAQWSANRLPSPPPTPSAEPSSPSPYTTLLRDLARANPSYSVYQWSVDQMQAENPGLVVDLAFFNALLAHEIGRRKYEAVFAVYARLMESRTPTTRPDAYTFSTIFRAIHHATSKYSGRSRRARSIKPPNNVPSPRAVYKDMLTCLSEQLREASSEHRPPTAPEPALDATALHKALRTFMGQYDYAAAYNTIRLFRLHPTLVGAPTLTTYRLVVNSLVARIRVHLPLIAIRQDPQYVWTYRFLGLGELPPHLRTKLPFDLGVIHRILYAGSSPRMNLHYIPAPDYTLRDDGHIIGSSPQDVLERLPCTPDPTLFTPHGLPTPLELVGVQPVEENKAFGIAPLERILKRAVLASFAELEHAPGKQVSLAIAEAKADMVL
ncbi:hypothetical protein GSI_00209 [Ganoderma sinense ZZ0214-1]|uniref:Uncharacterized protein n=1 Tax=Ganoderma sinense ZZ0214-1 TaxID=1077348 RepID=A0A2G8SRY5_9APHY|nr:hypothetical protein GSI_00209 [Ganoderma sinense ZZ0214-1]